MMPFTDPPTADELAAQYPITTQATTATNGGTPIGPALDIYQGADAVSVVSEAQARQLVEAIVAVFGAGALPPVPPRA